MLMDKKNFLFISIEGLIGDIAWQVLKEGHNVKYYIEEKAGADIADGFVPKSSDWKQDAEWADVIVFDDVLGQGAKAQKLRQAGKKVVGGTVYTDRLEDDRSFGQEELKKVGISILSYQGFNDFDSAIDYIKQNPAKYVMKPKAEKHLLFVGMEDDGGDVIRVLEAYKRVWPTQIKELQLQKKVSGVEIAVGAFFNGRQFIYPININFEHKKLFPGDLGPATGEMGTNMFWSGPNKLFNDTLKKMEGRLAEEGYVGYIDINCIVNGNGIYPLEFTTRFGYPTICIQHEGLNMPISEFLYCLADGQDFQIKTKRGFQVGVRLVVPPFPYGDKKMFDAYSKNATIVFKKKHPDNNHLEGIHIEDVKIVDDEWVVTGSVGVTLIVTGSGLSMRQAQQQVYSRIQNILIPNMYYRKDIGDRWYEDGDKLHSWGYLR